jgi:hypothetical protein
MAAASSAKYSTYSTAPRPPLVGLGMSSTYWRYSVLRMATSITTSSTSSTAAGFVSRICASRASEARTVSKPMMASPRSRGRGTRVSSARSVVASVPSPPQTRCARFTRSKVPGVLRSS